MNLVSIASLCGVLNIQKPPGLTSRDVVNHVQRLVRPARCGHAGTLDPMATGVLLVCVGSATRLTDVLHWLPKSYEAGFTFGQTSDTDDSTGCLSHMPLSGSVPSASAIESAMTAFRGRISQTPPRFSAVHVDGRRACKLARLGEDFVLPAREVQVHAIELIRCEWPKVDVRITCSSGTYIRSIARDWGRLLGCGGLMHHLVRTSIGPFPLTSAVPLARLSSVDAICEHLLPATTAVAHLPAYDLSPDLLAAVRCGKSIRVNSPAVRLRPPVFLEHCVIESHSARVSALTADGFCQLTGLAERIDSDSGDILQPRAVFL